MRVCSLWFASVALFLLSLLVLSLLFVLLLPISSPFIDERCKEEWWKIWQVTVAYLVKIQYPCRISRTWIDIPSSWFFLFLLKYFQRLLSLIWAEYLDWESSMTIHKLQHNLPRYSITRYYHIKSKSLTLINIAPQSHIQIWITQYNIIKITFKIEY